MPKGKVLAWCREQALFAPGSEVTAALSGGADSTAMLHLLLSLRSELGITLRAAHYNHRLRGQASQADEDFCRELCAQLGVPLICGGGDVAALARERGLSLELAARRLRYDFLLSMGGAVATAHTADDNLETLLLNLTRGAALRGLCGIPPRRGRVARPVLCLSRREIDGYLAENGLAHATDETNGEDFCRRNRLRRTVVPALLAENPALMEAVPAMLSSLREDEAMLMREAGEKLDAARRGEGYQAAALLQMERPLRRRALRRILEDAGLHDVTRAHLEAAEALLAGGPSARCVLPGGLVLRREYGMLLTGLPEEAAFAPALLPLPGELPLSGGRRLVCAREPAFRPGLPGMALKLDAPPLVRPRRTGDRLRLSGGEKSVKKLMIDRKIPAAARCGLPVFVLGGAVAAAWGLGADPAYRPRPGEACWRIQIKEERT